MDVVVDTDILSTFSKLNKPRLLSRLFRKSRILICPSVSAEIRTGAELGLLRLSYPPPFIPINLRVREKESSIEIRDAWKLGSGDSERLAVAKERKCLLLTNDRKVQKVADSISIDYLNLPMVLRELWVYRVMTKVKVGRLVDEIEIKDRIVIKNKEVIFR